MPPLNSPFHLLLVEDDEIDVELIERALSKAGSTVSLTVAENGLEALNLLRREGEQRPFFPALILLDLNMPLMNGFAFLRALREDVRLRRCIVFVLTSSDLDRDKLAAYHYNVAGYMLKSDLDRNRISLLDLLNIYRKNVLLPPLS